MLSEYDWKSTNFPKILPILTGILGKPFTFSQYSGIPQDFESAGSGILHKLQLSFLEILKVLGARFSVVHRPFPYRRSRPFIRLSIKVKAQEFWEDGRETIDRGREILVAF